MNELRMYVEHLFEGKVLTADNIELKEEIYGNLVARFEDYVAQGLSESEALARTKESITSVDDVLDDATEAPEGDGVRQEPDEPETDVTERLSVPSPEPVLEATQAASDPAEPVASTGATEQPSAKAMLRRKWPIVVGAVAAVVVLCAAVALGVGLSGGNTTQPEPIDAKVVEDTSATDGLQAEPKEPEAQTGDVAGTSDDTSAGSQTATSNRIDEASERIMPRLADSDGDDPDDAREYEATMKLANEIETSPMSILRTFAGTDPSKGADLADFVNALPLGSNADNPTYGDGVVTIGYTSVDHDIDSDAIDLALAYNVVAIMAVYPDTVDTVEIQIHESDDHPRDTDSYRFERAAVEKALAYVSGNAIVTIDGSLFASEGTWNEVFNNIATERFYDEVTDYAELEN